LTLIKYDVETFVGLLEMDPSTPRLSWEEYFKQLACLSAARSPCHRLKVGCLLVKDNRLVSQGYNGYLAGCHHESFMRDGHEQATVHAEQNAVADCAKRGVACEGCTAYITHYPCVNCTKILLAAGIVEIVYIEDYRNDEISEWLGRQAGVTIRRYQSF